ncbi:DNA-binding protein SMUBP-2-like [Brevipalpus obovatus]|uniref:DNA-binding protein SMUBP-2-like n=1 Tax=Brevipalpus obovatus TaxID=246614 RepID=UPI003D9F0A52
MVTKHAVKFALAQDKVAFILGPPGTGKTTTIIEILYQLRRQNKRVLVTAPGAAALDNILEKLGQDWFYGRSEVVRLGHPGRTETDLVPLALEKVQEQIFGPSHYKPKEWTVMKAPPSDEERNRKLSEINNRVAKLEEAFREYESGSNRCPLVASFYPVSLKRYYGDMLSRMLRIFKSRPLVFSTVIGAARDGPLAFPIDNDNNKQFDVLIIDESSQALEMASYIPLQMAQKVIIVGDPKGLPPTILSKTETSKELKKTLLQRCLECKRFDDLQALLKVQYRMNLDIMQWPSSTFYSNELVADEAIKNAKLDDVSSLKQYPALVLIDTKNSGMLESHPDDEFLCSNEHEVRVVVDYVNFLRKNNVKQNAIAIITPYKMQAKMIRNQLSSLNNTVVSDLEGLQGREREVVILSLVRSNDIGDVGLLEELQLINVAITRAKRHLAIVCDTKTIESHGVLQKLVSYLYEKAKVIPAKELQENLEKMGTA